ncbi:MAG: hybrid sensor histidine kinase/response regulator [Rhabdaerophilum calidifontis]
MAEESEQSGRRLAEIAHELRSPLGGVEAMIALLGAGPLDPGQRRIVEALAASCRHLRAIANAILDPGAEPPAGERPLGALLDDLRLASEARARARGLDFALTGLTPALAARSVEAVPLRQVLENLLDNAFRLTEAGGITLALDERADGRLMFAVSDSGPGLTEAVAARLIAKGGRIEGRSGGAGIGLSIAGGIVAAHGGRLTGGPGPRGGARFAFDWPGSRPAMAAGSGFCLIVDDHPAARRVLVTILEAAGHACCEAASVEAASEIIARARPAVVLTDLQMPDGGGRTLIARIARLPRSSRPRIIVVSAEVLAPEDPLAAEIDAMVVKPIEVRAVLAALGHAEANAAA